MKRILMSALMLLTFASPAHADRGHGGWGLGLGFVTGALIGAEIARPYYYPYYYPYYPPTVIVQQPVVVSPQTAPVWYYCAPARAYYPYVGTCPEPWREVPAAPPPR